MKRKVILSETKMSSNYTNIQDDLVYPIRNENEGEKQSLTEQNQEQPIMNKSTVVALSLTLFSSFLFMVVVRKTDFLLNF